MSDTDEQSTDEDDLRRHAETPAEGPDGDPGPDDDGDELRRHAEAPPEG